MLTMYRNEGGGVREANAPGLPKEVIWIDLLDPSADERTFVESHAQVHVPSREAISEIEVSSRLVVEEGVLYLSGPVVADGTTPDAHLSPIGFVLCPELLVTIRYSPLPTFDTVATKVKADRTLVSSVGVFVALLEAIVDRGADTLERLGAESDRLSHSIFQKSSEKRVGAARDANRLRNILTAVGSTGDRVSQARDVLLGVGRIASFAGEVAHDWIAPEFRVRLGAVSKDIASLHEYQVQLSEKIQFLLDAVLGYITIDQNDIFKILTIASVVGIPPTLLAGIWGMNFKAMPELNWSYGYLFSLAAIILSAAIPAIFFKMRGWF